MEINEKELTDYEIIKAMEICANWNSMSNCKDCPIGLDACCENQNGFAKYALDLIRRLQYGYSSASKASEEWREKYEAVLKDYYAESQHCDQQKDIIAKQKSEIERLTGREKFLENAWHISLENANTLDIALDSSRAREQEYKKQVDDLKELNAKYLDSIESLTAGKCVLRCELAKQAVKDTSKEILQDLLKWLNQSISFSNGKSLNGSIQYGAMNKAYHEVKRRVKKIAESKGVEVE